MIAIFLAISITISAGEPPSFVATDVPAEAKFILHRIDPEKTTRPVFASVERKDDKLTLTPEFPLTSGERYEARITKAGKILHRLEYEVPAISPDPLKVVRVLPSSEVVPANLLKFYLEFDQPVKEGRAIFDQIHIEDDQGKSVQSPWRRQELWSDDSKRLTLWIHPGRIKQGVNLREQLGPVLEPHRSYHLVIEETLESASGQPLTKTHKHLFRTGPEVREYIDASKWEVTPPASADGKLLIKSPRPLDPHLARRHIHITHGEQRIPTTVEWNDAQTSFHFSTADGWKPGNYQIKAGQYLEDLAGNTPQRIFDTDLNQLRDKSTMSIHRFKVKK